MISSTWLLFFSPLLAISIPLYNSMIQKKAVTVRTPLEYLSSTKEMLSSASDLDFKPADCRILFSSSTIRNDTVCFLSKKEPYALSLLVRKHLDQVAFTTGWDEFGEPGAFYSYNDNPKQTFSIGVNGIINSRDFVDVKEVKGYLSFVSFTINLTPGRR